MIKFIKDGGLSLVIWLSLFVIAGALDWMLSGCASTSVGVEMPKQQSGQSDDDYWAQLKRDGWF